MKVKETRKKILIIEDDKILAEIYRDKFTQAGFEVSLASEAKEGLKLIKKNRPALVILDILLPREDGIFFIRQLKKKPETNSIPVIAFSNFDDPQVKKQAAELGVKDYLIKANYTPQEIVKKVKSYLR